MSDKLDIILESDVHSVNVKEIDKAIESFIQSSRENYAEIGELTLESVSLLTSMQARSNTLNKQKGFRKIWNSITGKDSELRDAVLEDNTAALYAVQKTINCVLCECVRNQQLALVVNDRLNAVYLELKDDQIGLSEDMVKIRKAIVALHEDYQVKIDQQNSKMKDFADYVGGYCPVCRKRFMPDQIICPKCGTIHSLKCKNMESKTRNKMEQISGIIQGKTLKQDGYWSKETEKIAYTVQKAEQLFQAGDISEIDPVLKSDVDKLLYKCRSAEFQIAIVGVMKAGKSTLMNALMGIEIASVDINPETAALTKFRSIRKGFHVKISFHSAIEWEKLCQSAHTSSQGGKGSLGSFIDNPKVQKAAGAWINHKAITESADNIQQLKKIVGKWTSARSLEHLFVSEVEVGIDRSLFQMPEEVVFVDTPGLHDPVAYRSNITRSYIQKANAVLIAVPTAALTAEGLGTITTVLDLVASGKDKAYIVATQKDKLNSFQSEDAIIDKWIRHLVEGKKYRNRQEASSHIIVTSAYMHLCLQKVLNLSFDEINDPEKFSDEEYSNLENYVKKCLKKRRYTVEDLKENQEHVRLLQEEFGINRLQKRLERNLIQKYRELRLQDIRQEYLYCRKVMMEKAEKEYTDQTGFLEDALEGAETLRKTFQESKQAYELAQAENMQIRKAVEDLKINMNRILSKFQ